MEPTNQTGFDMFDSPLVHKTTKLVIEENIQDNPNVRLVDDPSKADVFVYPTFISYQRPDVKFSLGIFSIKVETVMLQMEIVFYEGDYDFHQKLNSNVSLVKDVRSNFYTMVDDDIDFAGSMLYNLIKKGIDESFTTYNLIIF